ncbi:MAG: helix-turn-helix transcriptional regulator [Nocardioidaceae bacterium]
MRRSLVPDRAGIGPARPASVGLAHLVGMDTDTDTDTEIDPGPVSRDGLEPVLTLSELAAHLAVSVQTLYDLRSQGRGPRGFRVGRELRFRRSEVDAWLARLEAADGARPRAGNRG